MNNIVLERLVDQEQINEYMQKVKRAREAAKTHPMEGMACLLRELPEEFEHRPDEYVFFH